jgi:hypothetical protein
MSYTYTARVGWAVVPDLPAREAIEAIPGVKIWRGERGAFVSWHALKPFNDVLVRFGIAAQFLDAEDLHIPPASAMSGWDDLLFRLRREGQMKEAYLTEWPLDYQKEGIGFADQRPGSLLHHPTGSGKTFTAIAWMCLTRGPALIVTRASTRVQYAREVERFTRLRAFPCKPAAEVRKRDKWQNLAEYLQWCAVEGQRPVIVCGWEALPNWFDALKDIGLECVIWDESHKGKAQKRWERVLLPHPDSPDFDAAKRVILQRSGVIKPDMNDESCLVGLVPMRNIVDCASELSRRAQRRLATTATPIPDRVRDLWGQLDLLEPWGWGNYRAFAFRYCDAKPGLYGGLDDRGESNLSELKDRLGFVVHHVPANIARASLPPKRRQTWYIPPSQQIAPSGGWKRAIKAATARGASFLLETRLAMAASAKRRAVIQRVSEHMESDHKVVVFTARRRDCEELADALKKGKGKGKPETVWCGHGGNSQEDRQQMLASYIACEGRCVLVGTGEAWGTGIDGLQCTDAAIFALLPWTPGALNQWEGRFTRLGQDRPVTIYFPIAEGTADEHLASILLEKLPAVERLAHDESLDGAAEALAGIEEDEDAFAESVLACIAEALED